MINLVPLLRKKIKFLHSVKKSKTILTCHYHFKSQNLGQNNLFCYSPHKLVLPENASKRVFYRAIPGEKGPTIAKLGSFTQILTFSPLIRSLIHQWGMLESPDSPKSLHRLLLPENVSKSVFYAVILGEKGPKVAKLVNLTQVLTFRPLIRPLIYEWGMLDGSNFPKSLHKLVLPENVILGEKGPKVAKLVDLTQILKFRQKWIYL